MEDEVLREQEIARCYRRRIQENPSEEYKRIQVETTSEEYKRIQVKNTKEYKKETETIKQKLQTYTAVRLQLCLLMYTDWALQHIIELPCRLRG